METQDFKTHELDHDIQRFMQIREQVSAEVNKIGAHARTLEETNKRLIAHFDVLKAISKEAQTEIKQAIKAGANEMGHAAAEDFSLKIKDVLDYKLGELGQAVNNAREILDISVQKELKKIVQFALMGCFLVGLAAFGWGRLSAPQPEPSDIPGACLYKIEQVRLQMEELVLKMKKREGPKKLEPQKKGRK